MLSGLYVPGHVNIPEDYGSVTTFFSFLKNQMKTINEIKNKFLLYEMMLSVGICPYMGDESVEKKFCDMTPEEVRKVKRKFRKVWRKIAKAEMAAAKTHANAVQTQTRFGLGKPATKQNKRYRRSVVKNVLERKVDATK